MKKRYALSGTAAVGTLLAAMTMTTFAAQATESSAKTIAFEHAGVTENDVSYSKTQMDYDYPQLVYEVEFYTKDLKEYDYDILAENGSILKISYDAEDAFRAGGKTGTALTLEQAKDAAVNYAGMQKENVVFEKANQEIDNGRSVYDIHFYTTQAEYEYEIDAATGFLLDWEYKVSSKGANQANSQTGGSLDLNAAKAVALRTANLKESDVTWGNVHPDYEDGRLVYEGKFFYGGLEYEFEIDAATGAVVDWDIDD